MHIILISKETAYPYEIEIINRLFFLGLENFHLRKKNFSIEDQEHFLNKIDKQYHNRIHIHQHYQHVHDFSLAGIHLKSNVTCSKPTAYTKSKSCHSFKEIELYAKDYSYLFLSPIFDSISKHAYYSAFDVDSLKFFFTKTKIENIYALGGVNIDNVDEIKDLGFKGIALLGYIWTQKTTQDIYKAFKAIQAAV